MAPVASASSAIGGLDMVLHVFDRCAASLGAVYKAEARGSSSDYLLLLALKFSVIQMSSLVLMAVEIGLPHFLSLNTEGFTGLVVDSCYKKPGN